MSKFCFLRMPNFASTWLKRPRSVEPGNGFVGRFISFTYLRRGFKLKKFDRKPLQIFQKFTIKGWLSLFVNKNVRTHSTTGVTELFLSVGSS